MRRREFITLLGGAAIVQRCCVLRRASNGSHAATAPRALILAVGIGPYSESPAYSYLAEFQTSAKPFTRQRTVVVDPGDRWQLRQLRCIRQHLRKRHSYRKPCEENLVHSAVQPAVDWDGWHVVFEQLRVFGLVGA